MKLNKGILLSVILSFGWVSAQVFLVSSPVSAAVDRGCYAISAEGRFVRDDDSVCNNVPLRNGTATPRVAGHCYINNGALPEGYEPYPCNNITVGAAAPTPGGASSSIGTSLYSGSCPSGGDCGLINTYINPAIKASSAIVAIVAMISFASAGITYASAESDPQKTSAAKIRIRNTIIGLIAYAVLLSAIRFFVVGGVGVG